MADGKSTDEAQFGLIGLGVMGRNLALNIEDHGFTVAVWNRRTEQVAAFLAENQGRNFKGAQSLEKLVGLLKPPRKIIIMIKAGPPIDSILEKLMPLLGDGDIVIDGGNSHFQDTRERQAKLADQGLHFVGLGVSGGEEGARLGPSLMPGCSKQAYQQLGPVFEAIAAKSDSGPCVTHVGANGAGHFVKMVHNGIEYADMQLIAEAYDILRGALHFRPDSLAEIFAAWNEGPLESFLMEITARIFKVIDPETDKPLIDMIADSAGQKDTGKWTEQVALDLTVPVPTISASLFARAISGLKTERVAASNILSGPEGVKFEGQEQDFIKALRDALYASKIASYAQGMSLIQAGSMKYEWNIDLMETVRIWKGGCIIRARLLNSIMRAYDKMPGLSNLLLDEHFQSRLKSVQDNWRLVICEAQRLGIPVPALSASLAYYDSYRTAALPQNLTQAQRDAFGSHTYERLDRPEDGPLHTDWLNPKKS